MTACQFACVACAIALPTLRGEAFPIDPIPTQQQLAVADRWLLTTCALGDEQFFNTELRIAGNALRATFVSAFENGPSNAMLRSLDSASTRFHARLRNAYQSGDTTVFGGGSRFLAKPLAQYLSESRLAFVVGYRSRALIGLGVIGTAESLTIVRVVAADTLSGYRRTAASILNEIQSKGQYAIK